MKILKYSILVISLFIVLVFSAIAYEKTRNYLGYCTWIDGKENMRLSTEERLDIAINEYLKGQETLAFLAIEMAENNNKRNGDFLSKLRNEYTLVKYNNKEEFLRENPNCCSLKFDFIEGPQFGLWDLAAGSGKGAFVFDHKVRYLDKNGNLKVINSNNFTFSVNNCGEVP